MSPTITANGRIYAATPGAAIDVVDADALVLSANGFIRVGFSGPTSGRPRASQANGSYFVASAGAQFWDTTVAKLVIFDGATWRDPSNGNVV